MQRAWLAWCAAGLVAFPGVPSAEAPVCAVPPQAPEARASAGSPDLSGLARAILPAVVGVVTTARPESDAGDPLKGLLDGLGGDSAHQGVATGFIVHPDGYIVTNAHVLEGAARVQVQLGDDEERLPATVVGVDDPTDVALLKVRAGRPLPALAMGDSDRLQVADWVMVAGSPFGLSHTVTVGIVSHVERDDIAPAGHEGYHEFIQTDASINPGNSGGPVVNLQGEVIGIATAINAAGQGIGFAVPINMAKQVVGQLRERGRVVRSWMGVSVREIRHNLARPPGSGREVVVTEIVKGGPAALSGLRVGDVIAGLNGQVIPSAARLRWDVASAGVGRRVSLQVRRGGDLRSLQVQLGQLPEVEREAEPLAHVR